MRFNGPIVRPQTDANSVSVEVTVDGGNPYALKTEKLLQIGKLFRKYFPKAHISTYARVDDLTRKSVCRRVCTDRMFLRSDTIGTQSCRTAQGISL